MWFHVREDSVEEFHQLALALVTDADLGGPCLERAAFVSLDDPLEFVWFERWTDLASLDRYLGSEEFRGLLGGIRVLGHLDEQLIVSFSQR